MRTTVKQFSPSVGVEKVHDGAYNSTRNILRPDMNALKAFQLN
jgi:hypothetical protein